eukprot:7798895-Pyramimonas_sp.AAC.1
MPRLLCSRRQAQVAAALRHFVVEKMPRVLCPGRPARIAAALKHHPLRTPNGVENVPRQLLPGRLARIAAALRDHTPRTPMVSRKCHACQAMRILRVRDVSWTCHVGNW